MTYASFNTFTHRQKLDGSHDSVCLGCLTTITSQLLEASLEREEQDHVCASSFRSIRSKRVIETVPANIRFPQVSRR